MIIVSNRKINKNARLYLTFDEFIAQATSEEGLDIDADGLAVDVEGLENEIYEALESQDNVIYFRTNDFTPDFLSGVNVQYWNNENNINSNSGNSNEITNDNNQMFNSYNNNNMSILQEENNSYQNSHMNNEFGINEDIANLLDEAAIDNDVYSDGSEAPKDAKMYVFGSSKGGTGKTFTAIMSTYIYAKDHPDERIALIDFDIIDGQVGISIHKVRPTMARYYTEYQKGYRDFKTMSNFCVKGNTVFPKNVDFYLAPTSGSAIDNNDFWLNVLQNCMQNYDLVVFDTGIDYLNLVPISYAYKIADKINIVTTTSIKSVNSVTKQIGRLKGEIKSPGKDENGRFTEWVFTKDDDLSSKINIIITQMVPGDQMNKTIYSNLSNKANVIATFGVITDSVSSAEFYGEWDVFDNREQIKNAFRTIMS